MGRARAILKKRFQNCDWRRRPLSSDQVDYARGDATHLLALDAALRPVDATRYAIDATLAPISSGRVRRFAGGAGARRLAGGPPRASFLAARETSGSRATTRTPAASSICAWRDAAAPRRVDESPHAGLPRGGARRVYKRAPADADALGIAFVPLPPYIACDAFGLRGELCTHQAVELQRNVTVVITLPRQQFARCVLHVYARALARANSPGLAGVAVAAASRGTCAPGRDSSAPSPSSSSRAPRSCVAGIRLPSLPLHDSWSTSCANVGFLAYLRKSASEPPTAATPMGKSNSESGAATRREI